MLINNVFYTRSRVARTHTQTRARARKRVYVVHKYVQFMRSLVTLKCGQWPYQPPTDRPTDHLSARMYGDRSTRALDSGYPCGDGLNLYIFIRHTHMHTHAHR